MSDGSKFVCEWECPKCHAPANGHGDGGKDKCQEGYHDECQGLLCECDNEGEEEHGRTYDNPCHNANCYHCGWGGTLPRPMKNIAPWEKRALEAGWIPPEGWAATRKPQKGTTK